MVFPVLALGLVVSGLVGFLNVKYTFVGLVVTGVLLLLPPLAF